MYSEISPIDSGLLQFRTFKSVNHRSFMTIIIIHITQYIQYINIEEKHKQCMDLDLVFVAHQVNIYDYSHNIVIVACLPLGDLMLSCILLSYCNMITGSVGISRTAIAMFHNSCHRQQLYFPPMTLAIRSPGCIFCHYPPLPR